MMFSSSEHKAARALHVRQARRRSPPRHLTRRTGRAAVAAARTRTRAACSSRRHPLRMPPAPRTPPLLGSGAPRMRPHRGRGPLRRRKIVRRRAQLRFGQRIRARRAALLRRRRRRARSCCPDLPHPLPWCRLSSYILGARACLAGEQSLRCCSSPRALLGIAMLQVLSNCRFAYIQSQP